MTGSESATSHMPPQAAIAFAIIWCIFMLGMFATYIIVLIALWKGMRAHQKISQALTQIAEKLQLK